MRLAGLAWRFGRRLAVAAALWLVVVPVWATNGAQSFLEGEVVRLVVGTDPGGGYDAYARFLAEHIEERTGATVLVENRPGAGGLVAVNGLATAPADGLEIMLVNGSGAALGQLLDAPGVRFDLARLTWLARVAAEPRLVMWSAQSSFRTLDDAAQAGRPIRWGGLSKTDTQAVSAALLARAIDLPSQIIVGYGSSSEAALAAMRGELDGIIISESSAAAYSEDGLLVPAVVVGRERSALFPEVPTVFEVMELTPEQAWWIDYQSDLLDLGRALAAPPDLPAELTAQWRAVLDDILNDPEVQAAAAAIGRPLVPLPAEELANSIGRTLSSLDGAQRAEVADTVLERYY